MELGYPRCGKVGEEGEAEDWTSERGRREDGAVDGRMENSRSVGILETVRDSIADE
jgi:hypothetical protein